MTAPLRLRSPLRGRSQVRNSPADRVPSHGTDLGASSHAIDLVPVDDEGRSGRYTLISLLRPEPADAFAGFGRDVLAPIAGVVRSVHDGEDDHPARRGLPSVGYALTQAQRLREGWPALAGNHVILETQHEGGAAFVALCHLQRGSITAREGEQVSAGEQIARCGNSGNSTEPHVHLQAMDAPDPARARAVPIWFPGGVPRNGELLEGSGPDPL
ncbi:M23 family metallopeptidase [Brachybacterium sp. AOP43-C2-M15]|uniref:M23 family metallopeptidase n=1 Tax=Brachybacterium sp. AOP43-C2-M15 TaxID=3457661 RepID=UPI004033E8A0